jgi:NAD(P)-dependent dehydrogenase (short-subunit alcohol dehydrogenase family)
LDFGATTTSDEVLAGIDLSGRRAMVTGASGGIGLETARALAAAGATVTMAVRDVDRGAAAADGVLARHPGVTVAVEQVDLADVGSTAALVDRLVAAGSPLDLLVCNAGVMACPLQRTPQGWELQFATNHLGHFALTTGVLDLLLDAGRADGARVVAVSSGGHVISPVVFDDIHFASRPYEPWSAYGQSKTANALFALELDRRYGHVGIHAYAVHPGMVATDLGRHLTREALTAVVGKGSSRVSSLKKVDTGASTTLAAATAPWLDDHGGAYLADCQLATASDGPNAVAPHARDAAAAERLWEVSEATLAGVA